MEREPIVQDPPAAPARLDQARALARLLDSAIRIPGLGVRVGLDPILGLVPGLGDVVGGALSGWILLAASRAGASRTVLVRMLGNILIDSAVGTVPFLGDLFDVGYKSNMRNMALLERHLEEPAAVRRSSTAFVAGLLALLALVVVGAVTLGVLVARALWAALGG
jgi:hypothetical protein